MIGISKAWLAKRKQSFRKAWKLRNSECDPLHKLLLCINECFGFFIETPFAKGEAKYLFKYNLNSWDFFLLVYL